MSEFCREIRGNAIDEADWLIEDLVLRSAHGEAWRKTVEANRTVYTIFDAIRDQLMAVRDE